MELPIEKYFGIHPGLILARELEKRDLKKRPFALSLHEYPQTINDITKDKRGLTPGLSLKIDRPLGLEEGTMFILQAHYELEKEKLKQHAGDLNFPALRSILFWDTDIQKIDWQKQYRSIIKRVFERGNTDEKKEILRFYGPEKITEVIGSTDVDIKLPIMGHKKP